MSNKRKTGRITAQRRTMSAEGILAKVDNLPTLPVVALRVGELVNDPGVGAQQIASVLQQDPSLSAKVLRLVNSSYYAIPGGVSDIQRAISFIGFNTLHQLVLSVSVLRALQTPQGSSFDAGGLWLHSLGVGACAQVLAKHIGHPDPGACFTAGLLHDVGKIALAIAAPDKFGSALDDAQRNGLRMDEAERIAGLPPHDRVGSRLARRWKFPAQLMVPIEHHHAPGHSHARRELSTSLLAVIDIVSGADELCRTFEIGNSGSPAPEHKSPESFERIGLTSLQTDVVYTKLMRQLEASKVFLELVDYDGSSNADSSASAGVGSDTTNLAPLPGARS